MISFINRLNKSLASLSIALFAVLATVSILGSFNVVTQAEFCTVAVTKVTVANIIAISDASHYPLIPSSCKGPISPESLPAILIRGYGLISSLGLNLFFFFTVYNGLLWIYNGIDGKSAAKAKQNLQSGVFGLGLIFFAYIFVNTFVTLFVQGGTIPSISSFFNNKVN